MRKLSAQLSALAASVGGAAALLGIASLASRLVGVFRDRLLSGTFGAGAELDAYYAAFRAPDFIYNLLVFGAVTAGFIPVFARFGEDKDGGIHPDGKRLANTLITVLGSALAAASVIGITTASWMSAIVAPGFTGERRELAVSLSRIMFISPIFLGLSGIYGGILQSRRRFFVYALAPILYNLGIIIGTLTLAPRYGVVGPAVGVVLGAFAHFVAQMLACRGIGFRFRPSWDIGDASVLTVARLTIPRVAGLAVSQINLVVLTGIASTIGIGGIAVFNFANNLQTLPVGIVGVSFAVAAFPVIAEHAGKGRIADFVAQMSRTVRTVLFLMVPATVGMLLLRAQIVRVVLGTGRFDWADTIATSDTLAFFALSLSAQALIPLLARACFAFEDSVTPLVAAVVSVALERSIAWSLIDAGMGAPGLALSFSIATVVNLMILWTAVRVRTKGLDEKTIVRSLAVTTTSALVMAFAMQATKALIAPLVDMQTFGGIFTQGLTAGLIGIATYIVTSYLLGSEEVRRVLDLYSRRVSPMRIPSVGQEGEQNVVE